MDIHKPKAAHNWGEFLIEIGTITCGIVIALLLEQVVSNIEWSRKVVEMRAALGQELAENLGKLETRTRLAPCVNQRLDALAAIVDRAAGTGRLPPLPTPEILPYHSWGTSVWSSALSAQTTSHLSAEALRGYGRFYQILDRVAAAECLQHRGDHHPQHIDQRRQDEGHEIGAAQRPVAAARQLP